MTRPMQQTLLAVVCALTLLTMAPSCGAHFLWLKTIAQDGEPQAFLFFGETAADEAYHLPERLAKTEVWRRSNANRTKLQARILETDDRVGLIAPLAGDAPCILEATQQYGIYGKSLLVYYAKHIHADSGEQLNAAGPSKDLMLDIVPRVDRGRLELLVLWDGKPLPEVDVRVAVGGADAVEKTTNERGRISLKPEGEGIIAVLASHLDKEQSGIVDDNPYTGALHYTSLTFRQHKSRQADSSESSTAEPNSALPPLPEPVSSFGAVVADGWLYVYGGHTGEEHQHSAANLSKYFRRIELDGGAEWEVLPMQTPLQGLALVSHGGKVYRVGGLDARNPTPDDDEDLHSVADFAEFDPASRQWRSLKPLPAPRSSHNAVVIGDRLYVVGGWRLSGHSPGDWQAEGLVYDFSDPQAGWQSLPGPYFKRRALATGHWNGRLVAIGGIDDDGDVSQRVDFFDTQLGEWSQGPNLPEARMAGFGSSACNMNGKLYVSGLRGIVYCLNETGSAWEEAGRLAKGRFFHQLLPANNRQLLAIGGASREGHLAHVESIEVGR